MQIKKINISDLTPYERNSRTHPPEQLEQIAASIREFGFVNPVLIDDDCRIIAGHGRVMAAQKLGMTEIPCLSVHGLSESQIRAYIIADNKIAENSGWDSDMLRLELSDLQNIDFDINLIGFSTMDIDEILSGTGTMGKTDPDAVPPTPEYPVTIQGDVWTLGKHRIMCGDATNTENVAQLLRGGVPHLMVTDPPYGVRYDASWRGKTLKKSGGGNGQGALGKVLNDHICDWRDAWNLFPGDVAYIWHASMFTSTVQESLEAAGFNIYAQIIWAKNQLVISRGHYHSQHEPCFYAVRKGKTGKWNGTRKEKTIWRLAFDQLRQDEGIFFNARNPENVMAISGDMSTVWEIPKPQKSETGHSTQKPVECMARPIRNNSKRGDAVYEPFSGSGTTIIAAEQHGRCCYAMELSPAYVDVAVTRREQFTGLSAINGITGKEFNKK